MFCNPSEVILTLAKSDNKGAIELTSELEHGGGDSEDI